MVKIVVNKVILSSNVLANSVARQYFCAVSVMDLQDHGELSSMTVEENKDCSITTDSVHKKET